VGYSIIFDDTDKTFLLKYTTANCFPRFQVDIQAHKRGIETRAATSALGFKFNIKTTHNFIQWKTMDIEERAREAMLGF
jgi:hypothetical protein